MKRVDTLPTKDISPIDQAVEFVVSATTFLEDRISFLEKRLTPVLASRANAPEAPEPVRLPEVSLGGRIREQANRITRLEKMVTDIIDRLEL